MTRRHYIFINFTFLLRNQSLRENRMKSMNAITERSNLINSENEDSNVWNSSYGILSNRKLARSVASLICQTHAIENKLKIFAEQKSISAKEEESIKKSCELYEQMLILIKEWKNLHFSNLSNTLNPWSQQIFKSPNKLII
ncbi:uncharacterized protein LOC117166848 isoform X1 [Belonocnema kinseyi]|uniref:uncharacterized protein LOC117166848 isoform X1 n=1 Tax=Belonocnema kinseyi TaxID=2817044 RepID=UPI00143DBF07|nr:uncharacterized protein LOC117166848 isoform X1 [Belonocnema kinseyi]